MHIAIHEPGLARVRLVSSLMLPPARKRLIRQGPSGTRADPTGAPLTDHRAAGLTPPRTGRTQRPNPNRGTRPCRTRSSQASTRCHSWSQQLRTRTTNRIRAPHHPTMEHRRDSVLLSRSARHSPRRSPIQHLVELVHQLNRVWWAQDVATEQRLETINNYADPHRKVAPIVTA